MAKKTARKKARRVWTDDVKERLIREAEAIPFGGLKPWAESNGFGDSWFRRMRSVYLAAHPGFDPTRQETLPAVRLASVNPPTGSPLGTFKDADDSSKRRMLAAYDNLSVEDKKPWREKLQATDALLAYYRKKFRMQHNVGGKASAEVAPADDGTAVLVAEYAALERKGGKKSEWLKRYGLNHQQIWEATHRGKSLANVIERNRAKSFSNGYAALPIPVVSHPVPTLDDAISAMEVKRDQLATFIEDLKRMRGGVR